MTDKLQILEVVRKVHVDPGDILLIRAHDGDVFQQFADVMNAFHGDDIPHLLVDIDAIDIVRELTGEELATLGLQRIPDGETES